MKPTPGTRLALLATLALAACAGAPCPPARQVPSCQTVTRVELTNFGVALEEPAAGYALNGQPLSTTPIAGSTAPSRVTGPGDLVRDLWLSPSVRCSPGCDPIQPPLDPSAGSGQPFRARIPLAPGVTLVVTATTSVSVSECHGQVTTRCAPLSGMR